MFAKLKDERPIGRPYFFDLPEQSGSVQKMPRSAVSVTFREAISAELIENVRRFWKNQEKALDRMQAGSDRWFERRRTGTDMARKAAERICTAGSFEDLFGTYRDWTIGAFLRIMADGRSCQQQIMAITGALGSPLLAPSRTEEKVEAARSGPKAPIRSKAA